jgi:hypothetical protein
MTTVPADWDTTRDVLDAAASGGSVGLHEITVKVAERIATRADDPEVLRAAFAATRELADNGFIEAQTPVEEGSWILGITPLGNELRGCLCDPHTWSRLRPALEGVLQDGRDGDAAQLSAAALERALRQAGIR